MLRVPALTFARHSVRPRHFSVFVAAVAALALGVESVHGACWDNPPPAFATPECVSTSGLEGPCATSPVRLWSDRFQPADSGQLPNWRDSSRYGGITRPGTATQDELFTNIDIVGDTAYVSYINGWSIWDLDCGQLGTNTCPSRKSVREIFQGHFPHFNAIGEIYKFIYGIDAHAGPDGKTYVALGGETNQAAEIGLSVWDATNSTAPKAIYQDINVRGLQTEMATINGRVYAFHASLQAINGKKSLHVYDVTAAQAAGATTPCVEDTRNGDINCPGVYKGNIGAFDDEMWVDVFQPDGPTGPTYVAHTDGGSHGLEILRINSVSPLSTTQILRVPSGGLFMGTQLFEYDDSYFLALTLTFDVNIYDVTTCLQSGGCSQLPSPVWSTPRRSAVDVRSRLTYTTAGATPFLYEGSPATCMEGDREEALYDLTGLAGNPNQIYEVTDGIFQGGETYIDPEDGLEIDFWGHRYANNAHGYSGVSPRAGKFYGNYFLRAAYTLFDIYEFLGEGSGPEPEVNVTIPAGTKYYTAPVTVSANAVNCSGSNWSWSNDGAAGLCTGVVMTATDTLSTYRVTCPHPTGCVAGKCLGRNVTVTVTKTCGDDQPTDNDTMTIIDGRPVVDAINLPVADPPSQYPRCSELGISADLSANTSPNGLTYLWSLFDSEGAAVIDPDTLLPMVSTDEVWNLDTTDLPVNTTVEIFADGFESGDTSGWVPSFENLGYEVRVEVSNVINGLTYGSTPGTSGFEVVPLGPLGEPSVEGTQISGALYEFEEGSPNATEWRWEFWLGGAMQDVLDWDDPDSDRVIQYVFPESGSWEVRVSTRNCETLPGQESDPAILDLDVTAEPVDLEVEYFKPISCGANTCFNGFDCSCGAGSTVTYEVGITATSEVPDNFEFDWTGEDPFSVEQSRPAGSPISPGVYRFQRVYNETGAHRAQTRAEKDGFTSNVSDSFARIIIQ